MSFEILIDDRFLDVNKDDSLEPIENKTLLSLLNDYQEGKWRHSKFHNFIWDNIAETSLSYDEREKLVDKSRTKLIESAKSLRITDSEKDIGRGSELAEIVLYGIMKSHYGALPVVPKIFYKQNSQDNAKGADSVHIVVNDNDFTIWFGEAKFFNDISNSRLGNIVKSVGNSLETNKLQRENSIICNVSDIDALILDDNLKEKIKKSLSHMESTDRLKPKLHIPILILHECDITAESKYFSDDYKSAMIKYHSDRATAYYKKHIEKLSDIHLYELITFHLIMIPVPNKESIVDRFVRDVKHYKEAALDD
tara:strand:- start:2281 stop:3207 length:927 start_codon:yes stop_codon:yes gene_type:complete